MQEVTICVLGTLLNVLESLVPHRLLHHIGHGLAEAFPPLQVHFPLYEHVTLVAHIEISIAYPHDDLHNLSKLLVQTLTFLAKLVNLCLQILDHLTVPLSRQLIRVLNISDLSPQLLDCLLDHGHLLALVEVLKRTAHLVEPVLLHVLDALSNDCRLVLFEHVVVFPLVEATGEVGIGPPAQRVDELLS